MTTTALSEFLAAKLAHCPKRQNEIADKLGYQRPNIITMWKTGETRIPLAQIAPLANILDVCPKELMMLALRCYYPEVIDVLGLVDPAAPEG